MKKQPVFCIFIALMIGIFLQDLLSFSFHRVIVFFALSAVFLALAVRWNKIRSLSVFFFFIGLGILMHRMNTPIQESADIKGKQTFSFVVLKQLKNSAKYQKYTVQILEIENSSSEITPFASLIYLPKESKALDFQHRYTTSAYLNKIQAPKWNFQFNYKKYMARQNVDYQIFSKDGIEGFPHKLTPENWIKQKRLEVLNKINRSTLSKNSRDFLKEIILADTTEMSEEITQDFAKSGLAHLLAISGSHMAILFWFLMGIFKLLPFKNRYFPIILSLAFIWGFSIFIDYGNSVMRACLMLSFYYVHLLMQRKPDLLHSLGLAGIVLLAFDTQQLFDVGFQLSFLAVFGIYWLNTPIQSFFPEYRAAWKRNLLSIFSITLSAQIITLPLIIYYFHQFSLISLVSNLVILPVAEIIIIFSLIVAVLLAFNTNIGWLNFLYDYSISVLLKVVHEFAEIKPIFFKNIPFHWTEVVLAFGLIYILRFILKEKRLKYFYQGIFITLLFFAMKLYLDFSAFQKSEVTTHEFRGEEIPSIKRGSNIIFYLPTDLENVTEFEKYVADPYATFHRVKSYQIYDLKENRNSP